jgi:hypothetical protein
MTPLDAIRRALDASHGSAKAFQAELASAGFIVVSAARAAEQIDALRLADAAMIPELEAVVQSCTTDHDWQHGQALPALTDDVMETIQPLLDALAATKKALAHG